MELTFVVAADCGLDYHFNLFLRTKQAAGRRPRTLEWYSEVMRCYLQATAAFDRNWPPTVEHCLTFFEALTARGLGDYTRNNYYRALRGFLNWSFRCGFLAQNPLDFVDAPKAPRPLPKAPPMEDVARFLATVSQGTGTEWRDARDLALFSLALDSGARIGELSRLRLPDIDPFNWQVRVYGQKDNKERIVEIGDTTAVELSKWLRQRAGLSLPLPLRRGHLFVSDYQEKGFRPFTIWGMRLRLKFWQARAGIPHFNFHAFRHAYAVYSLRNGADLMDVRDQLGHSSIKTTAIYTQVVNDGRQARHRKTSPRGNLPRGEHVKRVDL